MKPLTITIPDYSDEPITLRCTHEKMWPPPLMTLDLDIEAMWTGGEITQHDYQQIETWKRVCGLLKMGDKCAGCPLARLVKPRIGHEHHGRVDLVNLNDAVRKAIADRNKQARLEQGATPAPAPVPEHEPAAGEGSGFAEALAQGNTGVTTVEFPVDTGAQPLYKEGTVAGSGTISSNPVEPEPETFDGDVEEFRDEAVEVAEPDYPIPENGNGNGHAETFDSEHAPDPEGEDSSEAAPKAPAEDDELDSLLDDLDGDDD